MQIATDRAGSAGQDVVLGVRGPFAARHLAAFLAARAVPGVEAWDGHAFHRALSLPHGHGAARLELGTGDGPVRARLVVEDERDRPAAEERVRRLLDLDADPVAVDAALAADPALRPLVAATPGLRVAGSVDTFETAVRAVIGQQISVTGARTVAGRIVAATGEPLAVSGGPLTRTFPSPDRLADVDPALLPMPTSRRRTIVELSRRVADGRIDLAAGPDAVAAALVEVPGIGPWTAGYVRMRALGDADVFLATDLGVKVGLAALGLGAAHAERWRPWRSYALHHVWTAAGFPSPVST